MALTLPCIPDLNIAAFELPVCGHSLVVPISAPASAPRKAAIPLL